MAKRRRYLTESEISRMMNESDLSECSESDEESMCFSDSEDNSDSDNNSDECVTTGDGWSRNIQDLTEINFLSKSEINVPANKHLEKEIDFFNLFFDDGLIDLISKETNDFSKSIFDPNISQAGPSSQSPSSSSFSETNGDEIRVFFALIMLMSIIKKPTIQMYFSTDPIFATPFFNSVMSRNRFKDILRCLHFTSEVGTNKLLKIRPIVSSIIRKFQDLYTPDREICIDESLFAWKGRLGFRQYIPTKRARYGIKIYKLCESRTGYIWNFLIYTGKETELVCTTGLYGERVVKTLLSNLQNLGYNLYLDRFFTSPNLAQELRHVETNVCGTVSKKRVGMPKLPQKFLKGQEFAFQKNGVNIFGWKDKKKDVVMLSTFHQNIKVPTGKINRQTKKEILKSKCALEYNKYMGGVDTGDSVMYHYPAFRKTVKWYKKLFFGIMDMCLYNAKILF